MNKSKNLVSQDVIELFRDDKLEDKARNYLISQSGRIATVINMLSDISKSFRERKMKILDVAPHLLTTSVRRHFGNQVEIATLGWLDTKLTSNNDVDHHHDFDLNDTNFREKWVDTGKHDVIVMGEIFEHLFACPKMTLSYMKAQLAENGRLILQTPNAVGVRNRLKMLTGTNPFEMIQPHRQGHVREYTMNELIKLASEVGLTVQDRFFDDYLPERGVLRSVERLFPHLKRRMTIVLV